MTSCNRPFVFRCLLLAAIPAVIFFGLTMERLSRNTPDAQFIGMLQGDQPSYTIFARGTFLRGNGLLYASPFDSDSSAPKVLVNLTYSALGLLIRVCGGRLVLSWEIWRLVFGIGAFGGFALLVTQIIKGPARWFAIIMGFFGGGTGWLYAIYYYNVELPSITVSESFDVAEATYGWWCLNLFRQAIYPLELFYHSLLFAALFLYLRRRVFSAVVVAAILWWCHSITAALLTSILGTVLVIDWFRDRAGRKTTSMAIAILGACSAGAVCYNSIFLPRFPSIKSWIEATYSLSSVMWLRDYPRAYGGLLVAPLLLFWKPLRDEVLGSREGVLLLAWIVAVVCWSEHDLLFSNYLQPIHFARGHLYVALVLLAGKALEIFLRSHVLNVKWRTMIFVPLAIALIDNVFFVMRVAVNHVELGTRLIDRDGAEVIEYYKNRTDHVTIHSQERGLASLLLMETSQRVYLSEPFLTPFHGDRIAEMIGLNARGDIAGMKRRGVDEVILMRKQPPNVMPWREDPRKLRLLYSNKTYMVGKLLD
ncbi:hypothetical protein IT570_05435 [Candidatus Sumerlaeota bacterium]|nr:hypothetical protein [Candidatus Sumerlaeota bacterium]